MIIPKKIIDFCVYSSLIVSIGCGFLTFGLAKISLLSSCFEYAMLSFLGTFIIYNLQRIIKIQEKNDKMSEHLLWVKNHLNLVLILVLVSTIAGLILGVDIIHFNFGISLLLSVSLLLSIAYVLKIKGKNLREIPHLKVHLIALVWMIIMSFFPLLNEGNYDINNWIFGSAHYLYILAICIPFDIRDLKHDSNSQQTIPQLVGVQKAIIIGVITLISFALFAVSIRPQLIKNILFYGAVSLQLALLIFTSEKRKDYYFGGFIDGGIMLLGMSYMF